MARSSRGGGSREAGKSTGRTGHRGSRMRPDNDPADVAATITIGALRRAAQQARQRLGREPSPRDIAAELAPHAEQIDQYMAALEQPMQQLAGAVRGMNDPLRLDQISLNVVPDALVRMAQDIAAATASIARPVEQLRATLRLWWLFEIAPHAKTSLPHMLAIYHAREAGIEVPRWASERIMDCAAAAARGMTANQPGKKRQTDSDTLAQAFGFSGRRGRGRADDDVRRLQRDLDLAIAVHDRIFPSDGGRGDKFYIACQLVADETKTPVSAVTRAYRRLKEKLRAELQES